MHRKVKKLNLKKTIRNIAVVLLAYILLGATLPAALPKKIGDSNKATLSSNLAFADDSEDYITLIETSQDAFNSRVEVIRHAQNTLDIVYHTVHAGKSSDAFLAEVLAAADRGVAVRIVLDGKAGTMSSDIKNSFKALGAHPNISYRRYNPINILKPWELQVIFHDKFIVADSEYLILGGRNIGDRYYAPVGYTGSVTNDRDVLVCNKGATADNSVINQVNEYMNNLWNSEYVVEAKAKPSKAIEIKLKTSKENFEKENPDLYCKTLEDFNGEMIKTNGINLVFNPLDTTKKEPWLGYQLRELGYGAKENILIQTPYSTANKHYLEAFKNMADQTEVSLLTNSIGSTPNFPAFSNYYSQRGKFISTGINIYEYQSNDSIHGKSIIFDDKISAVGSFNADDRSLHLATETMLIIDSPEFAETLKNAMGVYLDQSLEVGDNNKYISNPEIKEVKAPFSKKALIWIVSVFSRLFQFII